jgi:hypothetical protein
MKILLTVIMTWLSSNFDLPATHEQPDVRFVTQQQMAEIRLSPLATSPGHELVAIYEDRSKTIFLSDRWAGDMPADLSVLVHETVHHLQNVGKLKYFCPEAREALAYEAQDRWLGMFGQSLQTTFELDPLTLKVKTACM